MSALPVQCPTPLGSPETKATAGGVHGFALNRAVEVTGTMLAPA